MNPLERRVLVTGLDGFTGSYLKQELELCGYSVVPQKEIKDLDLRSKKSVERELGNQDFSFVIHLAAISHPLDDPNEMRRVNVDGTRNLIEHLNHRKIRKAIFASTAQVYGSQEKSGLTEDSALAPPNEYAQTKLEMERIVTTDFGHDFSILRPFNYTGRGQSEKLVVPKIVGAFARRQEILELGSTDRIRSFGDVRDAAYSYVKLLSSQPGVYNFCGSQELSLDDIVGLCWEITGFAPRVTVNSSFVRESDPKILTGSNKKLLEKIGPLRINDFKKTLTWMLDDASA